MPAFDDATAVAARPDGSGYDIEIHPSWTVGDKPNGGYLMSTMARASVHSLRQRGAVHTDPLGMTATFLRAPVVGPALVRVEVLRAGRTASHVRSTLIQNDTFCVEAVSVIGDLSGDAEPRWSEAPPQLAPEDQCVLLRQQREGSPIQVNILSVTEERVDPSACGFVTNQPSGTPDIRAWVRFVDGRDPDPFSLIYATDCLPPATFELGSTGWVPTLQLSAYVRARPAPGPLRVRQRAGSVQGSLVDELCQVWDSTGRLVAQGSQLAQVRFLPPSQGGPPAGAPAGR